MNRDDNGLNTIFVLLLILFTIFVLGDISTTNWLIHNDPGGILHEANPFGALLYMRYGLAGLFLGKMFFFIPYSIMIFAIKSRYRNVRWFGEACEVIVLCLIFYSLIIFLNNVSAIIIHSALKGVEYLHQLFLPMKICILVLVVVYGASILSVFGVVSQSTKFEIMLRILAVIGPLIFYDPLYEFLSEYPIIFIAYFLSWIVLLGTAFYLEHHNE